MPIKFMMPIKSDFIDLIHKSFRIGPSFRYSTRLDTFTIFAEKNPQYDKGYSVMTKGYSVAAKLLR
jgi:hypothetical protein